MSEQVNIKELNEKIKKESGVKLFRRKIEKYDNGYILKEERSAYKLNFGSKKTLLSE